MHLCLDPIAIAPFNLAADSKMPFLRNALDPLKVQQEFSQCLPPSLRESKISTIRVIRHKAGRRCLIEYDLEVATASIITLIGKVRAKGTDTASYQLHQALWNTGFARDSADRISVPEPIAIVPAFQMWLQRKVPGEVATHLLPGKGGTHLGQHIAEAAYKLHQTGIPPHRRHTMADELRILHERLPRVARFYPQWEKRLAQILAACDRLGSATPESERRGIHRDFYGDQAIVEGSRLYLLDLDLYCEGDRALDIGNFIGHLIEQGIRTLGNPDALEPQALALTERFVELSGESVRATIQSYTTLTLVRHIYLSTQFPERQPFTEALLELCEQRLKQIKL